MAKDKRIADLPGISPPAVVALSRIGLLSVTDLVNADFERLAVVLEDFNEAARLVREARKFTDNRKNKDAPGAPGPLASGHVTTPRSALRISTTPGSKPVSKPQPSGGTVSKALTLAATSIDESGDWRSSLRRRISAVDLLLEHEATPMEVAMALLLESAEAGELGSDAGKFGGEFEELLEECISLRAVPVMPSGKLPKYYLEMAQNVSGSARRICAAVLLAGCGELPAERIRLLAEALTAGGSEPLVDEACRQAASRREAA